MMPIQHNSLLSNISNLGQFIKVNANWTRCRECTAVVQKNSYQLYKVTIKLFRIQGNYFSL